MVKFNERPRILLSLSLLSVSFCPPPSLFLSLSLSLSLSLYIYIYIYINNKIDTRHNLFAINNFILCGLFFLLALKNLPVVKAKDFPVDVSKRGVPLQSQISTLSLDGTSDVSSQTRYVHLIFLVYETWTVT